MPRLTPIASTLVVALILSSCAPGPPTTGGDTGSPGSTPPTASGSPTAGVTGNGSLYTSRGAGGEVTITRHAIAADGSLGEGVPILTAPGDEMDYPWVVDGVGDAVLVGQVSEYWTTSVAVLDSATGDVVSEVDAPRWCGGDGPVGNACVLLDRQRLARTTDVGMDVAEASILVSSLVTGEQVAEHGPFPGLGQVLGTSSPDHLMMLVRDEPLADDADPSAGTLLVLDLLGGGTREIGRADAGWAPVCAVGQDGAVGYNLLGVPRASVVGSATIGEVGWDEEENVLGCSADAGHLYVSGVDGSVRAIRLADGVSAEVLSADGDAAPGRLTR